MGGAITCPGADSRGVTEATVRENIAAAKDRISRYPLGRGLQSKELRFLAQMYRGSSWQVATQSGSQNRIALRFISNSLIK